MLNDQYPDSQPGAAGDARQMHPRAGSGRTYNDDSRLSPMAYPESAVVLPRRAVEEPWADNSMRQLLGMLARRKAILFATMFLVLGIAAIYTMLTPAIYEAQATLQIYATDGQKGGGGSAGGSGESTLVMSAAGGADHSFGTQLTILQSPPIKRGAIARLPADAQAKLQSFLSLSIEQVPETSLVEIKVSSHDADASAKLANAFCEEYVNLSRAENRGQLQTAINYVSMQKGKTGQKLNAARAALQRFKQQNQLVNVEGEAAAVSGAVHSIRTERESLKVEQAEIKAGIERSMKLIPTLAKYKVLPGSRVIRQEVMAIKSQIIKLNLERMEALSKYRPDRPEIQIIDDQLRDLQDQLKREARTEVNGYSTPVNDVRESMEKNLIELQAKDWAMQARETALAQASVQASAELSRMPALERQMSDMSLNLSALEDSYSALNAKQEALRLSQEARVANGSRLFAAEKPTSPSNRFAKMLGSAFLIGLLLALALAALVDWLDDGVYGENEAKMVSHLPILAQIPQLSKAAQKKLTSGADVSPGDKQISHMRESFRMLRTMIALSSGQENGYANGNGNGHAANGSTSLATTSTPFGNSQVRSVVITSSLPNEGKSVSSTNLAITTALSGESVILVDCDLRHPNLHRFFGLSNDIGLTSVVGGAISLADALQDTRIPGLRVLTTGPVTLDPMQIINSASARRCFDQLTEIADFVVIDTPPALVYAEAQVIAAMTDAMLLVISSQDAKKREVVRTRELLEQTGMIPLGAILNKVPPGSDGSDRYYERYSA